MQVSAEPLALFLARGDDTRPRLLELGGELARLHSEGRMTCEVVQQRGVGRRQVAARGDADGKVTNPDTAVHEGDPDSVLVVARRLTRELHPDVVHLQGFGDRGRDRVYYAQGVGGLHAVAESSQSGGRVGPVAVDDALDTTVQPRVGWLHQDRDHCD